MSKTLISAPLDDIIIAILGDKTTEEKSSFERRLIPRQLAIIIDNFLEGRLDYKVDFNPCDGSNGPYLWHYNAWYNDYQRWLRNKERSDAEQLVRWIRDANIKILSRGLMRKQSLDEKFARKTAENLLDKNAPSNVLEFLVGITEIITNKEQLMKSPFHK